jgi:hypothetical protein
VARRLADPDAAVTSSRSLQRANGWTYHEMKDNGELRPVRGSMTCAGITGLAICRAAIQDQLDMKRPKLLAESDRARADGFAWLAHHLSVRHHPGELAHQQQWFYYYLYGLERAASLSGVALIQDRDWYFEGAMVLVLAQRRRQLARRDLLGRASRTQRDGDPVPEAEHRPGAHRQVTAHGRATAPAAGPVTARRLPAGPRACCSCCSAPSRSVAARRTTNRGARCSTAARWTASPSPTTAARATSRCAMAACTSASAAR